MLLTAALLISSQAWAAFSPARQYTRASSQYHVITDAAQSGLDFSGNVDFYIFGWCYFDEIPSFYNPGNSPNILGKQLNTGNQRSYSLFASTVDEKPRFSVSADGIANTTVIWSSGIVADTWYFFEAYHDSVNDVIGICFTAEGSGSRGVDVTTAHSTGMFNSSADFSIAIQNIGVNTGYFDGRLQGIGVTSGIPTSAERDALYNSDMGVLSTNRPSLSSATYISMWNGNEASGDLVDSIGSNTLTDVNGVTTAVGHIVISDPVATFRRTPYII